MCSSPLPKLTYARPLMSSRRLKMTRREIGTWKTSEGSDALSTAFQKVDVLTGDLSGGYCTGTDIAEDRV